MTLLALFGHLEMPVLSMGRATVVWIAGGRFRRNSTEKNKQTNTRMSSTCLHCQVEKTIQTKAKFVLQMTVSVVLPMAIERCDAEMAADTIHVY